MSGLTGHAGNKMSKVLVAYFSVTGTTGRVAERLANAVNGYIYEIKPETPYTLDDLNWQDKDNRTSKEMADPTFRVPMADKLSNIQDYDVIFLGFPIWWYREPSIIDTFMESYDFTTVKVVPFATSGGTSLNEAEKNLQQLAQSAVIKEGKRLSADVTEEELKEWAEKYL